MAFTASDVQALREKTGCGMMDCKKALVEADGDMEKAIEILREKGLAAAAKKSGRIASEGVVSVYIEGNTAVIIEVNSETDFVAKNAEFKAFVQGCAKTVSKTNPADVDALLNEKFDGSDKTVGDALREKILTIGENIVIRRFARLDGNVSSYVHDDRIAVVTVFDADAEVAAKPEFAAMAKDICMQIVAMNPEYVSRESVPAAVLEKEKEIVLAQIRNDEKNKNKPQNILEKMAAGRLEKFYETSCLTEQQFVKDLNIKVSQYVENTAKALGAKIAIKEFVRYERGEGLEKRQDNFAEEVAKMVK